ncbi:MAG: DF family (seleno)protein [Solirubrobacteraceae bacterium]
MNVELLYFDGCPGYEELRERLPRLLEQAGVAATIEERPVASEQTAIRERFLGSPTVRIDGRDVDCTATDRNDYGLRCRLYAADDRLLRVPPDSWIVEQLRTRERDDL